MIDPLIRAKKDYKYNIHCNLHAKFGRIIDILSWSAADEGAANTRRRSSIELGKPSLHSTIPSL